MKAKGFRYGALLAAVGLAAVFLPACSSYMSGSIKSSIVINAPVEEVFAWVANPENQSKRNPEQTITDVHGSGLGAGYHFSAKSKFGKFEGEQVVIGYVPNQLWVEATVTGLDGIGTYSWIFLPRGDQTQIVKVMNVSVKRPLPARLLSQKKITSMAQGEQDAELKRVKAEVEKQ